MKFRFGDIIGLAFLTTLYASIIVNWRCFMMYAIAIVGDRETPAWQWTNTLAPLFLASSEKTNILFELTNSILHVYICVNTRFHNNLVIVIYIFWKKLTIYIRKSYSFKKFTTIYSNWWRTLLHRIKIIWTFLLTANIAITWQVDAVWYVFHNMNVLIVR